jgi:hypothetical protein
MSPDAVCNAHLPAEKVFLANIILQCRQTLCYSLPMKLILSIMLSLYFSASQAETAMSADEFEAYTIGQTLYYSQNGSVYGAESYFEGARVRWSFLDGNCLFGTWQQREDMICFEYGLDVDIQCWRFFNGDGGLIAKFATDEPTAPLYEARRASTPLECPGPDVGV